MRSELCDIGIIQTLIDYISKPETEALHVFALQVLANCLESEKSFKVHSSFYMNTEQLSVKCTYKWWYYVKMLLPLSNWIDKLHVLIHLLPTCIIQIFKGSHRLLHVPLKLMFIDPLFLQTVPRGIYWECSTNFVNFYRAAMIFYSTCFAELIFNLGS